MTERQEPERRWGRAVRRAPAGEAVRRILAGRSWSRMNSLFRRARVPLLLALLVLLPFWDLLQLPAGQVAAGNDVLHMFLPWWRFALDSLRAGEFPLWNPYLFSGVPFVANPQPALFYPPVWLVGLLPLDRAPAVLFLLHFWLAGLGTYGWLRSEGANRVGSLFGAIVFAFSGYFAVRMAAGHLGVVMTQAWLPFILWASRQALAHRRPAWSILGGVPVALSLLAGHTASFLYVGLAVGLYALYRAWDGWRSTGKLSAGLAPLLSTGTMIGVGLGLAAVQLLPTWEFLRLSTRQEGSYAFAAGYSWPPGYLLTLLVPNFFGEPLRTGYWGDGIYDELIFYVGVLPLLLGLLLGSRLCHKLAPFLLGLAAVGLLLALGQFGILHRLAYNWLPLFQAARAPARAGFLFTLSAAALGALALTWLLSEPAEALRGVRRWNRSPFPWLVTGLTGLVVLAGFLLFALQRDSNPQVGRLWHVANSSATFLFFFFLSWGLLGAWQQRRLSARHTAWLAVGLVLLDLWGFARSVVTPVAQTENAYWRDVAVVLDGREEGRVLPWGLGIFEHNRGMERGLESVFGYDPLELDRYHRFTAAAPRPQARAYDLLHARYLVTAQELSPEESASLQLIGQQGGVWVYERLSAMPYAWLVHRAETHTGELLAAFDDPSFDPRHTAWLEQPLACDLGQPGQAEQVRVVARSNNSVELAVETSTGGLLVVSQPWYPGWRASVDGEPAPLLRANDVLQSVCVPAGVHEVILTFAPVTLWLGATISVLCLLLVCAAAMAPRCGRWRAPAGRPDMPFDS